MLFSAAVPGPIRLPQPQADRPASGSGPFLPVGTAGGASAIRIGAWQALRRLGNWALRGNRPTIRFPATAPGAAAWRS